MIATDQIFWTLSRGTGIAAITLASVSVCFGLLSGRGLKLGPGRFRDGKTIHEALSIATIVLILAHGLLLLGDGWLRPGLAGIAVPFQMSYRPVWTGLGIFSGYGLVILGLSYYLRAQIGPSRWRYLHRFTAVFWVAGFVHAIGAGGDIGALWMWLVLMVPAVPAFVLLGMRFGAPRETTRPAPSRPRPARPQGT
ncbi:MAG: ferric reductase-like transmembrane domain-containing protein [Thermoleophilia bacterium]|nr:ferric reductase-like transmembrane domain-containing protein [Thermoleophilia bacterium]